MVNGLVRRNRVATISAVLLVIVSLAACDSEYALECGQGVDRDDCERVAAFGFGAADFAGDRLHVEARGCDRYFDPPPSDATCWTVRVEASERRAVVPVAERDGGDLFEPTDLFPLDP